MARTLAPGDAGRSTNKPRGQPNIKRSSSRGHEWVGVLHTVPQGLAALRQDYQEDVFHCYVPGLAKKRAVIMNGLPLVGRRSE